MTFMPYNTYGGYCTLPDEESSVAGEPPATQPKQIKKKKSPYDDSTGESSMMGGRSAPATTEDPVVHMADLFTTNFEARQNSMKQYKSWRNSNIQYKTD